MTKKEFLEVFVQTVFEKLIKLEAKIQNFQTFPSKIKTYYDLNNLEYLGRLRCSHVKTTSILIKFTKIDVVAL